MKKLKTMCHKCSKKDCKHRVVVVDKDFENGVAEYCDHGFERV